ncbi:glucosaminidase domain-containing protein [Methylobacterium planeticum]|uniref:DUF4214 domain-containing protein n=1 Tax=Methylobacterium planeticum TaxID=2615211 RepID=A0A6N6MQ38_9HYPH|nr:glucosaminidase domain-containing protein [Methylobacterium planeticum]KAB1072181.1 DUF4214 domain-containing protein [Methylobacterium planeticum]
MDPKSFAEKYGPFAVAASQQTGIKPELILAQAAAESAWGEKYKGNNLFGIKSHGKPGGVDVATHEVVNGQRVAITDSFRSFKTPEDSFQGYADFINENPRYDKLKGSASLGEQLKALAASGYATDPNYLNLIGGIAGRFNLGDYKNPTPSYDLNSPFNGGLQTDVSASVGDGFLGWNARMPEGVTLIAGFTQTIPNVPVRPSDIELNGMPRPSDYGAIAALYQQDLGRSPDADGLSYWGRALANGQSLMDVDQGIRGSAEAKAYLGMPSTDAGTYNPATGISALSPADIVNTAYLATLGRALDATGSDYFTQQTQNGTGLAGIMDAITKSPEYANLYDTPSLTPTLDPNGNTPTIGYTGMTPTIGGGLTAGTQGPGGLTPTQGPNQFAAAWDAQQYDAANPDVAASGMDPLTHYLTFGRGEGRAIDTLGQKFGDQAYLAQNPDVAAAGMSPLEHYIRFGQMEGRDAPLVGPDGTVQMVDNFVQQPTLQNYDLLALFAPQQASTQGPGALTPTIGQSGLTPTQGAPNAIQAWEQEYYKANPDVLANGMDALQHYITFGQGEGRAVNTLGQKFDGTAYLAQNQDVATAGLNPWLHYLTSGAKEGWAADLVGPDGTTQLVNNWLYAPTLNNAEYAPLVTNMAQAAHVWSPSLTPTQGPPGNSPLIGPDVTAPTFNPGTFTQAWDPNEYLSENPDVAAAGIDPAWHARTYGVNEGRTAHFDLGGIPMFTPNWGGAQPAGYRQALNAFGQPAVPSDNQPLGSGNTYNNGGVQYGGVNIGASALFDPYSSEMAYLNTQADNINQNAVASRAVENQLTQGTGTMFPTFAVNGFNQGNSNVVQQQGLNYLNNVNTSLANNAPQFNPALKTQGIPKNTGFLGVGFVPWSL